MSKKMMLKGAAKQISITHIERRTIFAWMNENHCHQMSYSFPTNACTILA